MTWLRRLLRSGVRRRDVEAAYRILLGREPESEAAIRSHLRHPGVWSLVRAVTSSEEFKQRRAEITEHLQPDWWRLAPPLDVECTIEDEAVYERLIAHVARTWTRLGTEQPFFSVVTDRKYLAAEIGSDLRPFYELGKADADLMRMALARAGRTPAQLSVCYEFGCGVGRATWRLAEMFQRVIAADVSAPHLALARRWLDANQISNVELRQIESSRADETLYDVWYSRLVLQHNPPPVSMRIVRHALGHLRPGGLALFQVPIYLAGYRFNTEQYMESLGRPGQMEMHCVPQRELIRLIADAGCELLEVLPDCDTGAPEAIVSNTFLVLKRAGCQPQ